jgi:hypothetical protein
MRRVGVIAALGALLGRKGGTMKRLLIPLLASGALLLPSPALASPAIAATATPVSMTLVEAAAPGASAGCAVLANGTGLCGHGQVIPLRPGH